MSNWTEQQNEIFEEIENGTDDIFVYAGAGTGKTTTIVEASHRANARRMAFLAFNKSIATELGERLPHDVTAKTFHSLGFAAIRSNGVRSKVNTKKTWQIIGELLGKDFYATPLVKLISLVKGSMVEGTDIKSINRLIDEYNIEFEEGTEVEAIRAIPAILTIARNNAHEVDFDDMIWLPLVENYVFPVFDILFVDEAQDFNEMQRCLIKECIGANGRVVVVGDPNQAIYGFRGADSNSMDLFKSDLEARGRKIKQFPLSVSWRCPHTVVKEANRYVSDFSCPETAINGSVNVNAAFNPVRGDIVLCRYNAPLINAFYQLILEGRSCYILGRDMTKGLINHVKKISKDERMTSREFVNHLETNTAIMLKRLRDAGKENQANNLEDKVECIRIFASRAETVGGIITEIKKVFDGKTYGDVMLSTVHKAKGLEADNVYILATNRMPHPRGGSEENNICYVAITRAKKNLYYCGPQPGIN
jgi:superfamily I DNA/RNA helicase|tara:strand:- start:396 stop:1826 length:1431 start_codon:yes stop_codon:yes gene_type:complete